MFVEEYTEPFTRPTLVLENFLEPIFYNDSTLLEKLLWKNNSILSEKTKLNILFAFTKNTDCVLSASVPRI